MLDVLFFGRGYPVGEGLEEIGFYFPGAAEEAVDEEDAGEFAHGGLQAFFGVHALQGVVEGGACCGVIRL